MGLATILIVAMAVVRFPAPAPTPGQAGGVRSAWSAADGSNQLRVLDGLVQASPRPQRQMDLLVGGAGG
jgi:hypothetical protein